MSPVPAQPDPEALLAHAGWLEALARRLVGPAGAADLVQDTWVAALERPPARGGPLGPWLRTVLWRLARDRRQGDAARRARQEAATRGEAQAETHELVARAELHELLIRALLELAEPYRSVLLLRYFDGLEPARIAQRRGVPASTVRTQLERGLAKLRVALDARFDQGRDAWCGMFVSALGPAALGAHSGAASLGISMGAITMKAGIAAVVGVAVIGAVIWGVAGGGGQAVEPRSSPALVRAAAEPAQQQQPEDPGAPAPERAPAAVSSRAPLAALPGAREAQAVQPAETAAWIRARLTDRRGRPLGAGRLALVEPDAWRAEAAADTGGEVLLVVRDPGGTEYPRYSATLEASAPGHATQRFVASLEWQATISLGTLELGPGGSVLGSVFLPGGVPANGASVLAAHPARDPASRDWLGQLGRRTEDRVLPTDQLGNFHIEGVPAGPVRVWARAPGHDWISADVVEVPARGSAGPVHIELGAERRSLISGRVLDPEGQPAPRATISYRVETIDVMMTSSVRADATGAFELEVQHDAPHELRATDAEKLHGEVSLSVGPGTTDVVLRLIPARYVELQVRDARGRPVESFAVEGHARTPRGSSGIFRLEEEARPGGKLDLRVPSVPFDLVVEARGHERATLSELDPDGLPSTLEIVIAALPGVRGRVVAGGEPLAGVEVELLRLMPQGQALLADGLRSAVLPHPVATATSAADGSFLLDLRDSDRYLLRARAAGWAGAELGPLALDAARGAEGLELALLSGGAIEGRVLTPSGIDPEGTIVAFNHGDGAPLSLRAGPGGHYRREHLLPGGWQVRSLDQDLLAYSRSMSSSTTEEPMEFDCTVVDGLTTRFDLDLTARVPAILVGELAAPGLDLARWVARLDAPADRGPHELAATTVDAAGRFELEAPAGSYQLVLAGPVGAGGRLELRGTLALLAPRTTWSRELATGRLEGTLDLLRIATPLRGTLRVAGDADFTGSLQIGSEPDGRIGPLILPAGTLKLSHLPPGDVASQPHVATFELSADALLEIALP